MNKGILFLLTFIPIIAGYLRNSLLFTPVLGIILFYVVPIAVFIFWFWLGIQYSKADWNAGKAIFIGNAVGMTSTILYLVIPLNQINIYLAGFLQMFTASVSNPLFGMIAINFEPHPNQITQVSAMAMSVISLTVMIFVFALGVIYGKKHKKI